LTATIVALDPTLTRLLATMSGDQSYVRPTETDIAGARRSHEHDAARFTPPERRAPVADVRDIDLSRDDGGAITIRIYRPDTDNVSLPTIVWYHGGGWTTGSLDTGDILARALCHGTPAVVASVKYRLAPEHPWPASVQDSTSALMWAVDHIDALGRDEAWIAVGGDSAGGNLAAVVAQTARDNGASLAAQILFYPFLDLETEGAAARYPSLEENAHGYYVTSADLHWCIDNYLPSNADPTDPKISPVSHPDLAALAPTVIAVAEYDPLRDQGLTYADALRASDVPVTVHQGSGLIHGYCDMIGLSPSARSELGRVGASVRDTLGTRVA
jgi:acetyl esterase